MDRAAQWSLVAAAWFLAVSVAVLGYLAYRHATTPVGAVAPLSAYAPTADGTALCPVTGERVPVAPETPQLIYQDQLYYFAKSVDGEGRDARTRFLMDPEKYLDPRGQQLQQQELQQQLLLQQKPAPQATPLPTAPLPTAPPTPAVPVATVPVPTKP